MAIFDLEIYSVTVKNQYITKSCNNTNSCCKLSALGIECQGQSCLLAVGIVATLKHVKYIMRVLYKGILGENLMIK